MPSIILSDNGVSSGSAGLKTTAASDGALVLQTSTSGGTATNAVYIDTAQNVGVGVTPSAWGTSFSLKAIQFGPVGSISSLSASSSNQQMTVGNNCYFDGTSWKYITSDTSTRYLQYQGSHNWFYAASGTAGNAITFTQAMTLDASGNLGVGTTSPLVRIHAETAGTSTSAFGNVIATFRSAASGRDASIQFSDGTNAANIGNLSGNLIFGTSGTERARIDSSGILRVNNTSTPSGNGGFGGEIAYIGNGSNGSLFYTTASVGSGTALECTRQNDGAGIYFFRNGSAAGFINITTGAISVNNSSDYRLKENVETVTGSLAKVMQVRPVTFNWKENGATGKSVIAHELQEVFPEVVFGEKDAVNEDGSLKTQSVALGNLVPDLIVAIQELKAIVDAQAAEIAALKGN